MYIDVQPVASKDITNCFLFSLPETEKPHQSKVIPKRNFSK